MNNIRQQQQFTPNYSKNKNQSQYPQYSNPNSIKNLKYDYQKQKKYIQHQKQWLNHLQKDQSQINNFSNKVNQHQGKLNNQYLQYNYNNNFGNINMKVNMNKNDNQIIARKMNNYIDVNNSELQKTVKHTVYNNFNNNYVNANIHSIGKNPTNNYVLNHDNQNKIDNVYYTATNKQNKIINSNNLTYNNNNKQINHTLRQQTYSKHNLQRQIDQNIQQFPQRRSINHHTEKSTPIKIYNEYKIQQSQNLNKLNNVDSNYIQPKLALHNYNQTLSMKNMNLIDQNPTSFTQHPYSNPNPKHQPNLKKGHINIMSIQNIRQLQKQIATAQKKIHKISSSSSRNKLLNNNSSQQNSRSKDSKQSDNKNNLLKDKKQIVGNTTNMDRYNKYLQNQMINVSIDLRKEVINDTLLNQKLIGRKVQSQCGYYNNVHRPIQSVGSKVQNIQHQRQIINLEERFVQLGKVNKFSKIGKEIYQKQYKTQRNQNNRKQAAQNDFRIQANNIQKTHKDYDHIQRSLRKNTNNFIEETHSFTNRNSINKQNVHLRTSRQARSKSNLSKYSQMKQKNQNQLFQNCQEQSVKKTQLINQSNQSVKYFSTPNKDNCKQVQNQNIVYNTQSKQRIQNISQTKFHPLSYSSHKRLQKDNQNTQLGYWSKKQSNNRISLTKRNQIQNYYGIFKTNNSKTKQQQAKNIIKNKQQKIFSQNKDFNSLTQMQYQLKRPPIRLTLNKKFYA